MNKVIIMSGVSGSGKSTYAEKLLQQTQGVKVSADHYFIQPDGISYHFDPSKLQAAHADCFNRFIGFLVEAWSSCVVVDNTNTTSEEIAPYMLGAAAFGYSAEIITLILTRDQLEACWKRNTHQVSWSAMARQYDNLIKRKLPPWWNNTDIPVTLEDT